MVKAQNPRRKRRRVLLTIGVLFMLGVMITAGVFLGAGVGIAAERVRDSDLLTRFIPAEQPSLPANKVNPPKPVDVSGPAVACAASSLTITAQPERTVLEPGEGMGLHVIITNSGRYPCLVNGGYDNLRLRLVNAAGVEGFNWDHCGFGGNRKLLMGPGMQTSIDFAWDGMSTAPGVCTSGQPALPGGDWQMIAALAEVAHTDSEPVTITVNQPVAPVPEPEPEFVEVEQVEPGDDGAAPEAEPVIDYDVNLDGD